MTTIDAERTADVPLSSPRALPKPRLQRPGFWRELLNSAFFIIAALIFSELALPRSSIDGASMEPTLWDGNHLLISRISYLIGEPKYDDIVVFDAPNEKIELLIKRVVGVPGDSIETRRLISTDSNGVEIIDGQVFRNGELLDEPYFVNKPCLNCQNESWVLGADEYFLMGDNRNHSNDSRRFGPVRRENIVGQAIFRYWPIPQLGTLK